MLVHKGGFYVAIARYFGGWRLTVWKDGKNDGPVETFDSIKQPRYKEKISALNVMIERERNAQVKDPFWESWDRRCKEDDEAEARRRAEEEMGRRDR